MRTVEWLRRSHGTVAACLAIFLALAGGAIAAATIDSGDVVNNSLKSVDLKNGKAVKGSDVVNGTLAGGDVRNGSLRGANVVDDSVSGGDVNEPSLALSQRVAQLGSNVGFALPTPIVLPFPNNTYTQKAGESNDWIGGGQVSFSAACQQPRGAVIYLLADGTTLSADNIVGLAQIQDTTVGATTRHFNMVQIPGPSKGQSQPRTGTDVPHTFYVLGQPSCNSGAGVTLDSIGIDVVAER